MIAQKIEGLMILTFYLLGGVNIVSVLGGVAFLIYYVSITKLNIVDAKYDGSWSKYFKSWFKYFKK